MEIYPFEVINFLLSETDNSGIDALQNFKNINFKFLDCRKSKNECLPCTLEIPESASSNFERLKSHIHDYCDSEKDSHIVFLRT